MTMVTMIAELVAVSPAEVQPKALSGLADVCEEMSKLMVLVRRTLPVESLDLELGRRTRKR
jgi:hypothetical protein